MKKVTLPKSMEPQARRFAEIHCELLGLGPRDNSYPQEYKQGFYNFCYEAYMHSLSPSGQMGQNPSKKMVHAQYDKAFKKLFDEMKLPKEMRENILNQIKSIVVSLTNVYLTIHSNDPDNVNAPFVTQVKGKSELRVPMAEWDKTIGKLVKKEKTLRGTRLVADSLRPGKFHVISSSGYKTKKGEKIKSKYSSTEYKPETSGNYEELVKVEKARYTKGYVLTMAIVTVHNFLVMNLPFRPMSKELLPSITDEEFANDEKLYKKLIKPEIKEDFIKNVIRFFDPSMNFKKAVLVKKDKSKPVVKELPDTFHTLSELNEALREMPIAKNYRVKDGKKNIYYLEVWDQKAEKFVKANIPVRAGWMPNIINTNGAFYFYYVATEFLRADDNAYDELEKMRPQLDIEELGQQRKFPDDLKMDAKPFKDLKNIFMNGRIHRLDQMTKEMWLRYIRVQIQAHQELDFEIVTDFLKESEVSEKLKDHYMLVNNRLDILKTKSNPRLNLKRMKLVRRRK